VTFFTTQLAKTTLHSISADIYWAKLLLPEIVMILFTQSAAVLHKYLNDEQKLFS